jgi:predicted SAM-dependent methyltransferase
MTEKISYLNLGCGDRFIESWINIDFISNSPFVRQHDLNTGIPLGDHSVDVVYHSHILEHFTRDKGEQLIRECIRVLKPGGIIRIAVPDLEQLARQYLNNLERAISDNSEMNAENYNWALIELFDQMIRNQSGGEMGKYWTREKLINEDYITGRVGFEFKNFRSNYEDNKKAGPIAHSLLIKPRRSILTKLKSAIRKKILPPVRDDSHFTQIGIFRTSGEIHQWMYDRYSLKTLLEKAGFKKVEQQDAFSSSIGRWNEFVSLDIDKGTIRKPDSLFMEAVK